MTDAVFLVGFMGSGKTELGEYLAEELSWSFIDLDEEICRDAGCSIPEIFSREGEDGFRLRERESLLKTLARKHVVVSCGGGVVTVPENCADLMAQPGTVCLEVSADQVWQRIGQDPNRPLLQADNPRQRIRDLLEERRPLYAQFPLRIQTDGFRTSEVGERVLSELRKK